MYPIALAPLPRFIALLRGDHPRFPSRSVREVGIEFVREEWHIWRTLGGNNEAKIALRVVSSPPFVGFATQLRAWGFDAADADHVARELCVRVDKLLLEAGYLCEREPGCPVH